MTLRMLAAAIGRGVEQRRRRVLAAERPVVADVSPDAASFSLAFRQDRNRRVIAVQALSRQKVAFDQRVQGPQGRGAGAFWPVPVREDRIGNGARSALKGFEATYAECARAVMGTDSAITLDGQSRVAMGITTFAFPRHASLAAKQKPRRCERRG
jgi:hypothetical protein